MEGCTISLETEFDKIILNWRKELYTRIDPELVPYVITKMHFLLRDYAEGKITEESLRTDYNLTDQEFRMVYTLLGLSNEQDTR